jgi:hypothetical protein
MWFRWEILGGDGYEVHSTAFLSFGTDRRCLSVVPFPDFGSSGYVYRKRIKRSPACHE